LEKEVTEYRKAFYRWVREEEEKKHRKEKQKEKALHTALDMGSNGEEREEIEENDDLMAQVEVPPKN